MPNKNTTRKVNKKVEVAKPKAEATNVDDDWGSGSIVVKTVTTQTRKKKVQEPVRESEVVVPPIPEWEKVGMAEADYKAMMERVAKQMAEWQVKNMKAAMDAELDSVCYWSTRLEKLERARECYNKKRGWSAEDIQAVDQIDEDIQECEETIERLEDWDSFDGEEVTVY